MKTDPLTKALHHRNSSLTLLDGSDSRFEWQSHPDSVMPGVVPFVDKPQQERSDYIFNANDSYWITNASEPLTGYSPLYGATDTPRSLRTRMNELLLRATGPDSFAGTDGKFTLEEVQRALFSNRSLAAELLRDELVVACKAAGMVSISEQKVDLMEACDVLSAYNGRLDLDSKGAVLFREWITGYSYKDTKGGKSLYEIPFDVSDPMNTPRGLGDKALAIEKLGRAVVILKSAGLGLDATLGDAQFAYRGDEKIALHGGCCHEGIANVIGIRGGLDAPAFKVDAKPIGDSAGLTDKGYPVSGGTSFLLGLTYTDKGPEAQAFLAYSQSGDPSSVYFTDQTKLFSEKKWRPVLFNIEDINKDVKSSMLLTGPK
ncbi:MAG: penicillin acylase family protein [Kordiimonadaceae bacterium]|nr:penicillin acylase family protein [Kordiimonadaceae bacterium]